MRKQKRVILLNLALLCVAAVMAMVTLKGYTQNRSTLPANGEAREPSQNRRKIVPPISDVQEQPEQDQAPIASYDTESVKNATSDLRVVAEENKERAAKNKKYDKSYIVEESLPGLTVTPRSAHWTADVPLIPVAQSSIVMIGQVVNAEAFLSNDKTGIYSEFTFSVDEILKNDVLNPISPGQVVIAERAGGSVKFPSGVIQRIYALRGQRMPTIGHRYVVFLKRNETTDDFSLLTGYELQEGKVIALDNIDPYKRYTGSDGNDLLNLVRDNVKQALSLVQSKGGKTK
jgi:hypothetical protein